MKIIANYKMQKQTFEKIKNKWYTLTFEDLKAKTNIALLHFAFQLWFSTWSALPLIKKANEEFYSSYFSMLFFWVFVPVFCCPMDFLHSMIEKKHLQIHRWTKSMHQCQWILSRDLLWRLNAPCKFKSIR